jgi:hypothetical protein
MVVWPEQIVHETLSQKINKLKKKKKHTKKGLAEWLKQ